MKKIIFLLTVLIGFVSVGSAEAVSYEDIEYRRKAISEVKMITAAVNLETDQFIALLELNERKLKDLDAARFFYSDDLEKYDLTVTEITYFYNKEIKTVLNSHQYKILMALEEQEPAFVTLAD